MKELLVVASLYLFSIRVDGISLDLPKVKEVTEMDDVSIPCNVTDYNGNMTLIKFNWMKSITILQSGQILRIPIISSDKSGIYTCYATIEGQTYSTSVNILVSYAPRWIEGALRKFSGAVGSSATLSCTVDSYPSPLFTWIGTDNVSLISSSSKHSINSVTQRSDLTINSLTQSDYGSYTCGTENKAGKRIYKLQLLTPGKPDPPQTCETLALKSDSVMLMCVEGYKGGVDQLDYVIKVYTTGNNLVTSSFISTRINSTAISFEVKGLSPKHEYTLDIITSNGYGQSTEPFSLYFTTAPGAMLLTTGSSDNSKVVALAVCIPLLFIAIVSGSLVAMYKYYLKQKHAPSESEVLTFQQVLSKFPTSNRNHHGHDSKELILGPFNSAATSSTDSSHINPAFVREESVNKPQPSLAGCGALEPLRVIRAPAQLNFIPGKSSTTEEREDRRRMDARALPPSISDSWEFPRSEFFLRKKLGDGSFGEVWEARIEIGQSGDGGRIVAVKMLRDNFTDDEQQSMLDDMKVMKSIGFHPNIIQLVGCCTTSYPLCMITEYASRGTLLNLLRQQRLFSGITLSTKDIESFTLQIASAMEHATSLKLLHRDMACRSVLMSNDLVCKLADFEKELHFQDSETLHKKKNHKIEIRWLPPESLFVMEKSVKSNIWSFGILIWECFTLGSTPYPGMSNKEVVDFIQRGGRMPRPNFCSQAMYEVVQNCWIYYPHKRASFSELRRKIQRIYETSPIQDMDFATGEYDSKSWNASPQDLGDFV